MLTPDEAQQAADFWRPQFAQQSNFERSWHKYFEMVGQPTPGGLETWLTNDQMRDAAEAKGYHPEPLLPTRQQYELSDCDRCGGMRYLRREVPITHPEFGRAIACPDCNTTPAYVPLAVVSKGA